MLFGYLKDEHYFDLVDDKGKVFKRCKTINEYNEWLSHFSPSELAGLRRRDTVVKWWDSNTQIAKLAFPVLVLVALIMKFIQ